LKSSEKVQENLILFKKTGNEQRKPAQQEGFSGFGKLRLGSV